jgi:hypothetical protein
MSTKEGSAPSQLRQGTAEPLARATQVHPEEVQPVAPAARYAPLLRPIQRGRVSAQWGAAENWRRTRLCRRTAPRSKPLMRETGYQTQLARASARILGATEPGGEA